TQIDFVLVRDRERSLVTDAKVVPYETVAPQHRPLICTLKIVPPRLKQVERCGAPSIKWWRMREKEGSSCDFSRAVTDTHDCRRNLAEEDRRDSSSCTVGTRHYEAWATEGRQAGMPVDR
ncbi:unnamed protein product, partial [Heligmosomoides polygyrus]|uniref:Endo/exonuclease/phosphatase domain-containing protein n=1 Tax=Heligmosomoides polygyrus TaxID=6339 RepID=A0A183GPC0_HELPZ